MEFAVEHKKLLNALQTVMRVVPAKSTMPVLAGVKVSAADGKLVLEGTDLGIFLKKEIPADVRTPGEALFPGRFLLDFVRRAATDTVRFDGNKETVLIEAGNARVQARMIEDIEAFPAPDCPDPADGRTLEILPITLQILLSQVEFAAERSSSIRPMLNSIYFRVRNGEIVTVATDGKRMAVAKAPGPDEIELEALIPHRAAEEMIRILNDSYDESAASALTIGSKTAVFTAGDTQLTTSLVASQYVPWENVIPDKNSFACSVTAARDALLAAVQQAELVAEESANKIKVVELRAAGKQIIVHSESAQIGRFESSVPAEVQGEMSICLDADFLWDSLASLPGENVMLGFLGPENHVLIQPADREYPLHVLMPIVRK